MHDLEKVYQAIKKYLDERDAAREEMLARGREIIRLSGSAISKMLSNDLKGAEDELKKMRSIVESLSFSLKDYPELFNSTPYWNALAEHVEAESLYKVLIGEGVPSPEELGVPIVPYVLGLADLIGELRRVALEEVKKGRIGNAWMLLEKMEEIFSMLSPLDYPDALLPGLRHKVDVGRKLIDDTKYFLVDMESRMRLEIALREASRLGQNENYEIKDI